MLGEGKTEISRSLSNYLKLRDLVGGFMKILTVVGAGDDWSLRNG